jgi:hypothetical protein
LVNEIYGVLNGLVAKKDAEKMSIKILFNRVQPGKRLLNEVTKYFFK